MEDGSTGSHGLHRIRAQLPILPCLLISTPQEGLEKHGFMHMLTQHQALVLKPGSGFHHQRTGMHANPHSECHCHHRIMCVFQSFHMQTLH